MKNNEPFQIINIGWCFVAIIIIAMIFSCKKEPIIQVGGEYHIKSDVFSPNAFQPKQPVKVDRLYIDPISGYAYAEVTDANGLIWYFPQDDLL